MMTTKVAQGASEVVSIGITRGKNLDLDVTIKLSELPMGLTASPISSVIMRDETETKVTLTAAEDAALGDFSITVVGHPTEGPDATSELQITVGKGKSPVNNVEVSQSTEEPAPDFSAIN